MDESVVIIGAGPAGLATAIQLERYGISPLVLERGEMGGLLPNANLVENYPGFPNGISGVDLGKRMTRQARETGVKVTPGEVLNLDHDGEVFTLKTAECGYRARIVVVASGTRPRVLADLKIPEYLAERVFYEVYPLLHVSREQIAIIGAGDAAFDYALNLAKRNNEVLILNRGEELKCLPLLWERSQLDQRIDYLSNTPVTHLDLTDQGRILLDCQSPIGETGFVVDYLIAAIGRIPNHEFLSKKLCTNSLDLENEGLLYFVGDVRNGIFRQTAIAVGDGVRAAMQIFAKLKEINT